MSQDPLSAEHLDAEVAALLDAASATAHMHGWAFKTGVWREKALTFAARLRHLQPPPGFGGMDVCAMDVEIPCLVYYRLSGGTPPTYDEWSGGDPGDPLQVEEVYVILRVGGAVVDTTKSFTEEALQRIRDEILEAVQYEMAQKGHKE